VNFVENNKEKMSLAYTKSELKPNRLNAIAWMLMSADIRKGKGICKMIFK
jgi:hypothetical protein